MSITVRLWTKDDLAKIGKDRKLTTIFMNCTTLSKKEMAHYPYKLRRTFVASFEHSDDEVVFYATDDEMALWFIKEEYWKLPISLYERITTYREIDIEQLQSVREE